MRQIDPSQQSAPPTPQPGTVVNRDAPLPWPDDASQAAQSLEENSDPKPLVSFFSRHLKRFRYGLLGILALLLLAFVPPLVTLSRLQRRVASSISNSLGRPVHLSSVSLTLLPIPGFAIQNLVVGEDPAFGFEPIIRADSVHVTLRISSLWRRQVEFSTISFNEPSVNLVHSATGKWNIEGILLQASRIETAPTAQRRAGRAPRFPYIEATGARLNIKQEQEKLPFSLTGANFALWLPDPHQWHLRLRAHPDRTDANVSDTGTIELESTLGAASSFSQVPFDLEGQWRDAQLGEASRVLLGHDAGWRGEMNISAHLRGTLGENAVTARLRLTDARPADFVPDQPFSGEVECFATATGLFHAFEDLRCGWPPASTSRTPAVTLTGSIPNVHSFEESTLQLAASEIPASQLITWLRATSSHVPEKLTATGLLNGNLTYEANPRTNSLTTARPDFAGQWQGQFLLTDATLKLPGKTSFVNTDSETITLLSSDLHLYSANSGVPSRRHAAAQSKAPAQSFILAPTPLFLGAPDPATLEGRFDPTGYTLHLTGLATASQLQSLALVLPPLGDGLLKALPPNHSATAPFHIDLTATRPWRGQQTWSEGSSTNQEHPLPARRSRR